MKRYLLIFALLLGAVCSYAQSKTDQAAVLQQCLDLADLQQYYPPSPVMNTREQVYVVQNASAFPAGLQLTKFDKPVKFIERASEVVNQSVACFVFHTFNITGNTANVTFDFYYTYVRTKAVFNCTVALTRTGAAWTVSETKMSGR